MIRPAAATAAHVEAIQLREEDAREVSPGWRGRVLENLRDTVAFVHEDGTVMALFGVVEGDKELGPWLLCSARVGDYKRLLMRCGREVVRSLRQDGRLAFNYIPKDSVENRRFVERLGFRILPSPGSGPDFFYLPHV